MRLPPCEIRPPKTVKRFAIVLFITMFCQGRNVAIEPAPLWFETRPYALFVDMQESTTISVEVPAAEFAEKPVELPSATLFRTATVEELSAYMPILLFFTEREFSMTACAPNTESPRKFFLKSQLYTHRLEPGALSLTPAL